MRTCVGAGDLRSQGAALLEALLAITVLSGGMISNLALLSDATTQLTASLFHQQALRINADLIGELELLPAALLTSNILPVQHHCSVQSPCNSADAIANSIYVWQQRAQQLSPTASAELTHTSQSGVVQFTLRINSNHPTASLNQHVSSTFLR